MLELKFSHDISPGGADGATPLINCHVKSLQLISTPIAPKSTTHLLTPEGHIHDLMIGRQDISPSNGNWGDVPNELDTFNLVLNSSKW